MRVLIGSFTLFRLGFFCRFLRPRGASKAPLVYPFATEIIHNNVLIIYNS